MNTYTNTIVIVKVYNNVNENDARYLYIRIYEMRIFLFTMLNFTW